MADWLQEIVDNKRRELVERQAICPLRELMRRAEHASAPRGFRRALTESPGIQVIAEVKRASPSAGPIKPDADAVTQARLYATGGAACLSVLTDEKYFRGSLHDLSSVRAAVTLPVLRKDFILDLYQVVEARSAGADAVLLIAEVLDDGQLTTLIRETRQWGMDALVEFYLPVNLPRVLNAGADLVGINNRDLRTFQTDIRHTLQIANQVPPDICLVSESGIRTRQDVVQLQQAGVKAILVGETLMRAPDPVAKLRELLGS